MKKVVRKGLVTQSLERISRNLFRDHREIITELVSNSSGVYALYNDNELYYVGRASDLKRRVNQHLKDRHDSQWTHFSLFLVKRSEYIGDIESLLIRIAEPVGNRSKPKGGDSKTLLRQLRGLIKQKHREEIRELISGSVQKKVVNKTKGRQTMEGLVAKRTFIYAMYKGVEYRARITPKGLIYFEGASFSSPTAAAKAIVKGTINGWTFWRIRNSSGDWVKLSEYN